MKKLLLLPALLTLICALNQSALAKVTIGDTRISRDSTENLIQWRTTFELDNIGFNIFKEQDGVYTRLNSSILPGSVLKVGDGCPLDDGSIYSWTDVQGASNSQYYIQALGLDGDKAIFGAFMLAQGRNGKSLSKVESLSPSQADFISRISQSDTAERTAQQQQQEWPSSFSFSKGASRSETNSAVSLQTQQAIAAQPAVKLLVNKTGWYRVGQPELIAAGLDRTADSRNLHLYVNGAEIPMRVNAAPGLLQAGDSVEFYATAPDTPTTDTRVYWLIADTQPGQRIPVNSGQASTPATAAQSFAYTVGRRERRVYFSSLINGDAENFFGAVIASSTVSQTLTLRNVDTSATESATMEIALQGVANKSHQVKVFLNNSTAPVTTIDFQYRDHAVMSVPVSMSALREGDNKVQFVGTSGDLSLIDYVRLTYAHTYMADGDALSFSAASGQATSVGGFSSSQIRLIDITDPDSVQEIAASVETQGTGYALKFTAAGAGTRIFYAFADGQAQHPLSVVKNQPSNLSRNSNGADMIIISHGDFMQSVQSLAELRRRQGLTVAVVDIEDVFDEFSYGTHTPQAIKDFLSSAATNWTTHPRFVLLVGKASYDPRNYLGFGKFDFVPTKLVDATYMESASDEWLADFDGDAMAEMAIGRLPAKTAAEANLIISKIVGYTPGAVNQRALFVADTSDPGFTFEQDNRDAAAQLPDSISVQYIDRGANANDALTKSQIINAINQGPLLVNYAGHGNLDVWRSIFASPDALSLSNGNRLPVFVLMTCLNGYFIEPNPAAVSLADALLKAQNGGAVAVWASSGETVPSGQQVMDKQLYQSLFGDQNLSLGEAVHNAKAATFDTDVRLTWVLFGDPAMRLKDAPTPTPTPVPTPTPSPSPSPTPVATFDFGAANYTASESAGSVSIVVTRSGDASSAATVDYMTGDGTANQRTDYTIASGTLAFAAGEMSKTFAVLIIDDAYVDGNRTVNLTLSKPIGATLGAQSSSVLTITDNDVAQPTANPIDEARFFVRQQYLDFLNREPDTGGFDYWTSLITSCPSGDARCINSRRVTISAAFFIEQEFQDTGSFVYRFYKASYGERPAYAQFISDRSRVVGGTNLEAGKQAFADSWVQRAEFLAKYPANMQAGAFVDQLIYTIKSKTNNVVDLSSNRSTYLDTLQTSGRGTVVRQMAESSAFKAAEFNEAFVLMQYFGYLRRDPDQGGYDFWLDVLNNRVANNYRSMVCAFTASKEYQERFNSFTTRTDSICGQITP